MRLQIWPWRKSRIKFPTFFFFFFHFFCNVSNNNKWSEELPLLARRRHRHHLTVWRSGAQIMTMQHSYLLLNSAVKYWRCRWKATVSSKEEKHRTYNDECKRVVYCCHLNTLLISKHYWCIIVVIQQKNNCFFVLMPYLNSCWWSEVTAVTVADVQAGEDNVFTTTVATSGSLPEHVLVHQHSCSVPLFHSPCFQIGS